MSAGAIFIRPANEAPKDSATTTLARGLGLFLGSFCLLNLVARFRSPGFDLNLWWIDLRWFPSNGVAGLLLMSALLLIAFSLRPPRAGWRRALTVGCTALLAVAAFCNAVGYYLLLSKRSLSSGFPIALSLLICAGLILILWVILKRRSRAEGRLIPALGICAVLAILFPIAQMFCFGKTDYRRVADTAVVLGARVYASGEPSTALADRVRTACDLYHKGLVSRLIFSGGPGEGPVSEPESMRRMALDSGVRPQDILLDEQGLNTRATARNTVALMEQRHAGRVLVVSHFYHLPRVKMAFEKEGLEVYTVPAREPRQLKLLPYYLAREVAAEWVYYLRLMA
jgi:uncharacterized SAM-binding protein YcdF (DUF218 family)